MGIILLPALNLKPELTISGNDHSLFNRALNPGSIHHIGAKGRAVYVEVTYARIYTHLPLGVTVSTIKEDSRNLSLDIKFKSSCLNALKPALDKILSSMLSSYSKNITGQPMPCRQVNMNLESNGDSSLVVSVLVVFSQLSKTNSYSTTLGDWTPCVTKDYLQCIIQSAVSMETSFKLTSMGKKTNHLY